MKILAPLLVAAMAVAPVQAAPAPRVAATSIEQLAQPLPIPYTPAANARADVARARAKALREHKKLLIDLGGNWCLDCRVLAGIMKMPDLEPFLDKHYVEVSVDIGRYDQNLDIAAKYGAPYERGAPAVLIVDPKTGRLLNKGHTMALTDARHLTPQALADWLASWI